MAPKPTAAPALARMKPRRNTFCFVQESLFFEIPFPQRFLKLTETGFIDLPLLGGQ